jgi:hypothetical protein
MIQRLWEETLQTFAALQNKTVVHCNEVKKEKRTRSSLLTDLLINIQVLCNIRMLHRFNLKIVTLRPSEMSKNAGQSTGLKAPENFNLYHHPLRTSNLKGYWNEHSRLVEFYLAVKTEALYCTETFVFTCRDSVMVQIWIFINTAPRTSDLSTFFYYYIPLQCKSWIVRVYCVPNFFVHRQLKLFAEVINISFPVNLSKSQQKTDFVSVRLYSSNFKITSLRLRERFWPAVDT